MNKKQIQHQEKNYSRKIAMTAMMTAFTCAGGFISIQLPPPLLPITLQTFFACMAGFLLGKKWGAISQLIYMMLGLVGLPVFASGGGFMYVFRPSFGFVPGFVLCAFLVGLLSERIRKVGFVSIIIISVVGLMGNYIIGLPYMVLILTLYMGKGLALSLMTALNTLLYLIGDLATLVVLAAVLPVILKRFSFQ